MSLPEAVTAENVRHCSEARLPISAVADVLNHVNPTTVVDVGCYGWRLAGVCSERGHSLIGVDLQEPPNRPEAACFAAVERGVLAVPNHAAGVVVASHVLEHASDPLKLFAEMVRVLRPGGVVWIEAPSEMSARPSSSNDPYDHSFASFWDDPTHVRPWTPGALYRLALGHYCVPEGIERGYAGTIPVVRMRARKPRASGGPLSPRYVSFLGVPPGLDNGWRHVWGEDVPATETADE